MHSAHVCLGWHAHILAASIGLTAAERRGLLFYADTIAHALAAGRAFPFIKIVFQAEPDSIAPERWVLHDPDHGRILACDVLAGLFALARPGERPDLRHAITLLARAPVAPPLTEEAPINWHPDLVMGTVPHGQIFIPLTPHHHTPPLHA